MSHSSLNMMLRGLNYGFKVNPLCPLSEQIPWYIIKCSWVMMLNK